MYEGGSIISYTHSIPIMFIFPISPLIHRVHFQEPFFSTFFFSFCTVPLNFLLFTLTTSKLTNQFLTNK